MKSWNGRLSKLLMVIFAGVLFFSFQSSIYAAGVGSKLSAPEAGWTRYNDNVKGVYYTGNWVTPALPGYYGGSIKSTATVGSKAMFRFYGTKIRIISDSSNSATHTSKAEIQIDGVKANFHINYTNEGYQYLVFEKVDLEPAVHEVVITCTEAKVTSLDAFDIDSSGYIVDWYKASDLTATAGDTNVTLKWDAVPEATGYLIKYGTQPGIYTDSVTVSKDVYQGYTIGNLQNGTPYYFTVHALVGTNDTGSSNEATATPQGDVKPEPVGGRAIFTIYLINGAEKEFDLSMTEVNAFIDWYENKQSGTGTASYAINKHENNKGPFTSRKEYVIFDKILTFSIDEYSAK
ncbi:fibronectin type III domain-containing protein [Paenibacillus sp. FSL H7-0918]|uniref:fibronectin type III domain-containing protein n=1 Tax=Paenibacillus sp. FSL H7-0918 TaxID=2921442 RepID=UPI0030F6D79D